jgi:DNA polymerase III subunit epsilon
LRAEPGARSSVSAYAHTPMPAAEVPWRDADFCVIDLETTGLDAASDEIIAFATVPIAGARVRLHEARYRVVRPRRMPRANTIVIHGLRSEELAGAPSLSEVMDELLAELTGRVLVAHVASLDERFLRRALLEAGTRLRNPMIDTAGLAAELFSRRRQLGPDEVGLTPLAHSLGLPVHRPHEADGDALTAAQVFLALATELDAFRRQTVGSLSKLRHPSGPLAGVRRALRRIRRG